MSGPPAPRPTRRERAFLFESAQRIARPVDEVFPFYADPRNLERITPPWLAFEVITPDPIEMRPGALIEYRLTLHRLPIRWLTRIVAWEHGRRFIDMQVRGPYRLWHHTHEFEPDGDAATRIRDVVRYRPPLGALADRMLVRRDVERIFAFRRDAVAEIHAHPPAG